MLVIAWFAPRLLAPPPDILPFVPMASDISTYMYYTRTGPFTERELVAGKQLRRRSAPPPVLRALGVRTRRPSPSGRVSP